MNWQERSVNLGRTGRAIQHDSSVTGHELRIQQAVERLSNGWKGDKDALAGETVNIQTSLARYVLSRHYGISELDMESLDRKELTFLHGQDRVTVGTYIPGALVVDRFNAELGFIEAEQRLDRDTKGFTRGLLPQQIQDLRYMVDIGRGNYGMVLAHLLIPLRGRRKIELEEHYLGDGVPVVRVLETSGERCRYARYPYKNYTELTDSLDPMQAGYIPPFSGKNLIEPPQRRPLAS